MTPRKVFSSLLLLLLAPPATAIAGFSLVPSGTFPTTPNGTYALVVDYDDDGDLDVLVAALDGAHVDFLENDGTGSFTNSMLLGSRGPSALAAADFDGDGDRDLAVTIGAFGETRFDVYKKQNNGSLANPVAYPLDSAPRDLVARDFDGDGDLDLAINLPNDFVPPNTASNIQLFRGAGNGTFAAWDTLSTAFTPMPLRSGDLDGDGRPDLVVVDSSYYQPPGYFYGYFNTASGFVFLDGPRLQPRVEDLVLLDLDGDGDPDAATVYWNGTIGTNLNDGAGGFDNERLYRLGGNQHKLATADFDLDGDDDLVVTSDPDGIVATFRNEGNGYLVRATSNQVTPGLRAVGAGDFDGDGRPDVVAVNKNGSAIFLRNQATPPAALENCAGSTVATGSGPAQAIVLDLDGDANPDVATVNDGGTVSIFPGQALGALGARVDVPIVPGAVSLAGGDLSGDGVPDLAVVDPGGDLVHFLRNDGGGQWTPFGSVPTGNRPVFVAIGDLNADGRADVATVDSGTVTVRYQPAGSAWDPLAPATTLATPALGTMLSVGDVNADGRIDFVVSFESSPVWRFLAAPNLTFGAPSILTGFPGRWNAVADFDGDGKADIAAADRTAGLVRMRRASDGTTTTTAVGPLPIALVAAPNVDFDGKADLVFLREDGFVGSLFGGVPLTWGPTCEAGAGATGIASGTAPSVGNVARIVLHDDDALVSRSFLDDGFLVLVAVPIPGPTAPASGGIMLERARPNPAVRPGPVRFALSQAGPVRLEVIDVRGRIVRRLEDSVLPAGTHQRSWDGADESGRRVAPGLYFYRLESGGTVRVERQALVAPGRS